MIGAIIWTIVFAVMIWNMIVIPHFEKEAKKKRYIKDCCDRAQAINDNYNRGMKELRDKYGDRF